MEPAIDTTAPPTDRPTVSRILTTMGGTLRLSWEASRRGFVTLAALTIVAALLPPLVVLVSKRVVDLIASVGAAPVTAGDIMPWVVALGALATGQRILAQLQSNRQQVFSWNVNRHASELFVQKSSQSDLARFDDPSWHDRVQRVSRETNFRPFNATYQTIGMVGSAVTLLGMLGVLLSLHPLLLGLALISVVIPVPFERRINRQIYSFYYDLTTKERQQYYYRWLLSDTRAAKDLRAFVLEQELLRRHNDLANERQSRMAKLWAEASRIEVIGGLLGGLALTVAYVFVAFRGAAGALSAGDVAALIGAIASVTVQFSSISGAVVGIDQHAPFLKDYFDFLETPSLIVVPEDPTTLPSPIRDGIRFDDVVFSYPGQDRVALDHLNLYIEGGEMLALVGDNGAGKTTMVKLLLRFYDPTHGSVAIGGVDLRDTDPVDVRRRLGVLFQDYTNVTLTARDAVSFGRIDMPARDDELWRVLEAARADDIVKKLPNGLDSFVGRMFEGGADLSGGEWQRLALARLMYRDADVWILDEPTSSLDPEAEAAIFAELKTQLAGRIGIVISHRFSTVRIADRIAVVQDGRITEVGSHDELVALGGRYAQLFELQAAAYR